MAHNLPRRVRLRTPFPGKGDGEAVPILGAMPTMAPDRLPSWAAVPPAWPSLWP